jgi:8-amino-7-oxononanoate synthase
MHLRNLAEHFHSLMLATLAKYSHHKNAAKTLQLAEICPKSPIFSLQTEHPRSLAKYCQEGGYLVRAVVPPTVPTRRVRVCLHAGNTYEQIDGLVMRVERWLVQQLETSSQEGAMVKAQL